MRALLPIILAMLILAGCTGGTIFSRLNQNLTSGNCPGAIALIDESGEGYDGNGQLLYLLDSAMVYMQCGDLDAAQARFRDAEDLADRLWTESLTRNALSLVTNDTVTAYAGEDFERVMIHLMSAIGYLQAGQTEDALVEARRLDTLLAVYNDKYDKKNVYKEDAFARYLSGILHEGDGDWDAAFIDYRRAAEVYRDDYRRYGTGLPEMLRVDLMRSASVVGRTVDIADLVPLEQHRPVGSIRSPVGSWQGGFYHVCRICAPQGSRHGCGSYPPWPRGCGLPANGDHTAPLQPGVAEPLW
jgi:tetratricopeptide (TPR) repeat protein